MNTKRRNCRVISICMILCILVLLCKTPFAAQAEEVTLQTRRVRVGYVISPGYQEGGPGEYKSGQGYEYLQKIAAYAGWEYEYVYGGFEELLQQLMDGKIDIMGNITYTAQRAERISYGAYEQGREAFYLYVNERKSTISSEDHTTINGKKIGVSAGSYQEKLWQSWCEDNQIQCEVVRYTSAAERQKALNDGEIDGTIGTLLQSRTEVTENWKSVLKIGEAPFYFAVNQNEPELLAELNMAQRKLLRTNPYYNEELSNRYMQDGILNSPQLSEEEINWIEQHDGIIKMGCMDDMLPLSDQDSQGNITGVIADYAAYIQDKYEQYGFSVELTMYADYQEMIQALKDGTIDAAAPMLGDLWNAEKQGICLTDSMLQSSMLLLHKDAYLPGEAITIGINQNSPFQLAYAEIYFPDKNHKLYSSYEETIDALHEGKVDVVLACSCAYLVFEKSANLLSKLSCITLPARVDITMAVSKQNPDLISFLNREIAAMGETEIFHSVAVNSNVEVKYSLKAYILENPVPFFLALGVLVLILTLIIIKLNKAIHRARTDSMTGLLNKNTMQEFCKVKMKRGGVLFMIDLDNFKRVNDVLGHEAGDKVILHLAKQLRSVFGTKDLIGRFGGDEFFVFSPDWKCTDEEIAKRISHLQESFETCEVLVQNPDIACSASVGVLFIKPAQSINYARAFEKVDAALYQAKKNGKRTFVIVREDQEKQKID